MLADPQRTTGRLAAAATRLNLEWAEDRLGPGTLEAVRRAVRQRLGRDPLDRAGARWVPYGDHLVLLDALAEHLEASDLRAMGHYGASQVHRVVPGAGAVLRLAGPQRLLKRADWIWRTYADFGDLEVLDAAATRGALTLEGFDATPAFCTSLQGFLEGLLARVGAEGAKVGHPRCMARGDPRCRFEGTWG